MNKYVFTFGSKGTGKSTMLACLADYITSDAPLIYDPRNLKGAEVLFTDWLEPIERNLFPKFSDTGFIYEVDIVAQDHEDLMIPLTFLEMSGEDLVEWDPIASANNPQRNVDLQEKLTEYLASTQVFLIVSDYQEDKNSARQQDGLIVRFLNRIIAEVTHSYVLLVITKWDKAPSRLKVVDYARSNLKRSFTFLNKSRQIADAEITKFTIGQTDSNNNGTKIIKRDNDRECRFIIEWLLNNL